MSVGCVTYNINVRNESVVSVCALPGYVSGQILWIGIGRPPLLVRLARNAWQFEEGIQELGDVHGTAGVVDQHVQFFCAIVVFLWENWRMVHRKEDVE